MSIKIFTAYKVRKKGNLWPVVRAIRKQGHVNVRDRIRTIYKEAMEIVDPEKPFYKEAFGRFMSDQHYLKQYGEKKVEQYAAETARVLMVDKTFTEGYCKSTTKPFKSLFNFDVSVTFREYKGDIYVIPYCDVLMRNVLDFLGEDKRLRDYHYQNQSDPPSAIPTRQWRERRKVWEYLTEHHRWPEYLTLDLCSWESWGRINPTFKMREEMHKRIFLTKLVRRKDIVDHPHLRPVNQLIVQDLTERLHNCVAPLRRTLAQGDSGGSLLFQLS